MKHHVASARLATNRGLSPIILCPLLFFLSEPKGTNARCERRSRLVLRKAPSSEPLFRTSSMTPIHAVNQEHGSMRNEAQGWYIA
jgi:hypothetical protein